MTWEELQILKQAKEAFENIARTMRCHVNDLRGPYESAYKGLCEVIERWETKP
ncbi:hypothetical protein MKY15_20770 [Sporosarcina sp. FSL K6-1540]|uniref:hypothetical protein n=1 Tax=Sporosarcina sp. FSL K6-1540 TaxID=2921555 RepID=UPI00315A4C7A